MELFFVNCVINLLLVILKNFEELKLIVFGVKIGKFGMFVEWRKKFYVVLVLLIGLDKNLFLLIWVVYLVIFFFKGYICFILYLNVFVFLFVCLVIIWFLEILFFNLNCSVKFFLVFFNWFRFINFWIFFLK